MRPLGMQKTNNVRFYKNLDAVYAQIPRYAVKIVMGNANANTGKEDTLSTTDKSSLLIDIATARDKIISSTFPHKKAHSVTWNFRDRIT